MQVYIAGSNFRQTAQCDCGWHGAARWTRGSANVDAGIHAAQSGHMPMSEQLLSSGNESPVLVLQAS